MGAQSLSIQEMGVTGMCAGAGGEALGASPRGAGPLPKAPLVSYSSGRGAMCKHIDTY